MIARRLTGCAVAVLGLACAPAAGAGIVTAESVLPPGESGFVALPGLLSGSGSPHLYDQQTPFIGFHRHDARLDRPGTTETPRPGVRIVRDAVGVPAVTAANDPDVWWGAGYATAQDRLFQLDIFRRAATGRLSEVLGSSYLAMDIQTRRDFYTSDELDSMFAALPAPLRARYAAYRDGINAWLAKTQQDPAQLPAEFVATLNQPRPFSVVDLTAIGAYLARTTPNGDGADLANAQTLNALGAERFNTLLPLRIPGQVSSVPAQDGAFPAVPGRTAEDERAALVRSAAFVAGLPLPSQPQPSGSPNLSLPSASALSVAAPLRIGGSYMVARRYPGQHRALLFSGPELGFSAPEELYEIEIHRPGLDARGVTAPGAPVIAIGHNAHIAWGVTSGLSQTNALYAEQLVPGHPEQYMYQGVPEPMDCREETFDYRSPPTALLSSTVPTLGSMTLHVCRTRHGPVQARAGGVAYARRYVTWKREAETLAGLAEVDEAANVYAVDAALAHVTWNENMIAADDQGNIGYWHPGLIPLRPAGWDKRLPYPGTGEAEWSGVLPVEQRPHVINPEQGWLTSWNNIPSQGWTTGNDPASERVAGPYHRAAFLNQLVRELLDGPQPTFAALQELVRRAGSTAQQRSLAATALQQAAQGASGPAAAVLGSILRWDGSYAATDAAGTVDPGVAAWQEFKHQAQALALGKLGAQSTPVGPGDPGTSHVFDASLGQAYALRTLSADDYRTAAAAAFGVLSQRLGSADPVRWRTPRTIVKQMILGAEQPPRLPFFDRGTWEQLVELGSPGCIDARSFSFRIHRPRGRRIVRVDAYIGARRIGSVRARRGRSVARLVLPTQPQGRFTLKIVARTNDRRRIVTLRTYDGCRQGAPHVVHRR